MLIDFYPAMLVGIACMQATRQKLFALKTRREVESRLEDDSNLVRTIQDFSKCWGTLMLEAVENFDECL